MAQRLLTWRSMRKLLSAVICCTRISTKRPSAASTRSPLAPEPAAGSRLSCFFICLHRQQQNEGLGDQVWVHSSMRMATDIECCVLWPCTWGDAAPSSDIEPNIRWRINAQRAASRLVSACGLLQVLSALQLLLLKEKCAGTTQHALVKQEQAPVLRVVMRCRLQHMAKPAKAQAAGPLKLRSPSPRRRKGVNSTATSQCCMRISLHLDESRSRPLRRPFLRVPRA